MNLPSWFACGCVMDLIPYEYYSYMRIWDGRQDVLVLGHWEFCPPGAIEIPFLQPYLSQIWTDVREDELDQLGEVPGFLGRWKGKRNTRYTGQCFIGTEADWQRGGNYDHRPNLAVDEEGIPIGCCSLPIGTDGHFFRKVFNERHWSTLVRTGDRDFGTVHQERSWGSAFTTSAHYDSVWFHRRSWQGVYETTDHFAAPWHQERSWPAVVRTMAHYAGTWEQERSWQGVCETTDHFAGDWDRERSFAAVVTTSAVEPTGWDQERAWSAVVKTTAHHAGSWHQEESWVGVWETLDHFAGAWDRERSWQMVKKTLSHYAAAWDQERSWQAYVTVPVNIAAGWHREHQWGAVIATVDNVTSFNCAALVATGSTQGTAAAIVSDTVKATSTGAGQGILLPAGCYRVTVWNDDHFGGNLIKVYPPSGATISGQVANAPVGLNIQSGSTFSEIYAGFWVQTAVT